MRTVRYRHAIVSCLSRHTVIPFICVSGTSSNAVALQGVTNQKFDKIDSGPAKAVRNGEIQRDIGGIRPVAEPNRVTSLVYAEQLKPPRVSAGQNEELKIGRHSDAVSSVCRVTSSSGLTESDCLKTGPDAVGLASRRASRPAAKKRPADPGVAVSGGFDLASPGDVDGKPRVGGIASGSGSVEEFRCRLCNYSGRSQHCLSKHYRAHDLAYKICRYCRRAFERPSDLLRHEERHRRRDVLGSGAAGGGLDASSDSAVTCSAAEVVRQPAVGRIDSYSDGVVASSRLLSARLGAGDNEVTLCFDEPAADALLDQPAAPPPSKLRDVYSIMAGIFVNQHFLSFGQASTTVNLSASEQVTSPRSGVDDRSATIIPDFGQRAFLHMLDLKMVSESGSLSTASATYGGGGAGHVPPAPRGALTPPSAGSGRERRRKGIPNRALTRSLSASDSPDTSVAAVTFAGGLHDGLCDTAKVRCAAGDAADDVSPTFTACNGVASGKSLKLGPEGVVHAGYSRESGGCGLVNSHSCRRRSRKSFIILCKVCNKRLNQVGLGLYFEPCRLLAFH